MAKPTPEGVPVAITSPACSDRPADTCSMMAGTSNSMSDVLASCRSSPFTSITSCRFCASGTALRCTTQGPIGQKVSSDLPLNHWPWRFCRSRAVTSLMIV